MDKWEQTPPNLTVEEDVADGRNGEDCHRYAKHDVKLSGNVHHEDCQHAVKDCLHLNSNQFDKQEQEW